ncbi:MAG: alkaline phosphatase family protein, partial [Candidatus Krumholzibacteria bacterium]
MATNSYASATPLPRRDREKLGGFLLRVCLLWGAAFGFLEAAYFTRANHVFPLGSGHVLLSLFLGLEYTLAAALVAGAAYVVLRKSRGDLSAAPLVVGPWFLLLLLAVTHFRDRMDTPPGTAARAVVTVAILVVMTLLLWFASRLVARNLRAGRRVLQAAAVVLLAAGALWLVTSHPADSPPLPPETVTADMVGPAADTGLRVLLIGLDGGSWNVIDPLIERGELPTFGALASRGCTVDLKTFVPTYSPIVWTSVATGKVPAKHGIHGHVQTRVPLGLPKMRVGNMRMAFLTKLMKYTIRAAGALALMPSEIYTSNDVLARPVWDIVGDFGLPSVVVEWYATAPARPTNGIQVSERFHRMKGKVQQVPRLVYPDSLAPLLEKELVAPYELQDELLFSLLDAGDLDADGRADLVKVHPVWFSGVRNDLARDLSTVAVTHAACALVPEWRLATPYFRAMDSMHHFAWRYMRLAGDDLDTHPERRFRTAVESYYRLWDGLLEDLLAHADENTVVIAMSDHGYEDHFGHDRAPDGFFIMAGGPTLSRDERGEISVFDVAPTVLALLGIPVPEDMDGEVARDLVDPEFWARYPVRTVAAYPPREGILAAAPTDEEALRQLR